MGFQFRFHSILQQREHAEDEAGKRLKQAKEELNAVREEIVGLHGKLRDSAVPKGPIDGRRLELLAHYRKGLLLALDHEERREKECRIRVDNMQQRLLHAYKERKVMESLQEIDRNAWSLSQKRLEAKVLDEFSVTRRRRRGEESSMMEENMASKN